MDANFAWGTRGDVRVTFPAGEFQTDWAIDCELAVEAAFHT
jgi:hypothetical protein